MGEVKEFGGEEELVGDGERPVGEGFGAEAGDDGVYCVEGGVFAWKL